MIRVKKSFDITPDLAQQLDDFLQKNPGLTFSLIANQALTQWLRSPRINFSLNQKAFVSDQEIEKMIEKDTALMDDLAGDPPADIVADPKRRRAG